MTGTFFLFTPDPGIYAVYGALMSPTERQARQGERDVRRRRQDLRGPWSRQDRNPAMPLTLRPACRQRGQGGYGPAGGRAQIPAGYRGLP